MKPIKTLFNGITAVTKALGPTVTGVLVGFIGVTLAFNQTIHNNNLLGLGERTQAFVTNNAGTLALACSAVIIATAWYGTKFAYKRLYPDSKPAAPTP